MGGGSWPRAWRKEEIDAARHPPGEERSNKTGKGRYRTRKRRILRSDTLWPLVDESKETLYGGETDQVLRSALWNLRCVT